MPSFLSETFLNNSVQQWLIGLGVAVATFLLLLTARRVISRRIHTYAARTATDIDDLFADLLRRTRWYFILLAGMYAGSHVLTLSEGAGRFLGLIFEIVLLLQVGVWGASAVVYIVRKLFRRRFADSQSGASAFSVVEFLGKVVLWSLVTLLALDNLGVDITALVTGLGIGGVAIALALQNILGDLFASLSILLDKPFEIGDAINVDGMIGTVEYIGLKTTRVRSLSGEQIIFSNADLLRSRIRNYKRMEERRVVFTFGVIYRTPSEKLERIGSMVKDIITAAEGARFDRAHFLSFAESALMFEVVYYVKSADYGIYMNIQQSINLSLHRKFEEEGIVFAYPTRTLYLQSTGTPS